MVLIESKIGSVRARLLERFAGRLRRELGLPGEVHILIASNAKLKRLNRRFRRKNRATDVLSFPAGQNGSRGGDIAISAAFARGQAKALGHPLRDELKVLMLHGMLHLAGFDHETDGGEMAVREQRLRRKLKLPTTLIARVPHEKRRQP